jgi:sugar (pentulose or hexulose) kinase
MADIIGLDVGSSFIKAAAISLDTLELRRTYRLPFPAFVKGTPPLHREVDPTAVVEAAQSLLVRLLEETPKCHGIVLCGQMHGFVLVNCQGEPLSNYISWQDQRVSPAEFEEALAKVGTKEREEIGDELGPGHALFLLAWLKRRGALPAGEVTPVSIPDFVAGRLCGTRPIMEPTQAAAFGALRLDDLGWHEGLISKLGLDAVRWPDVRPAGAETGRWRGIPCYAAVGDQQCALAGALLGESELSVNIGTGSQVAMITGPAACEGCQIRPYFDGRFLRTITHIPGGRALNALVGLLTELGGKPVEDVWLRIEPAVEEVASTDLRANIAFSPGPFGSSGSLENLHEGNLRIGHLFRAVFESMARNYTVCAGRVDPDRRAQRVVFCGGISRRSPILRDMTASALGLPHRLSPHPEDTLIGLMVLSLAFTGLCRDVRAAAALVAASLSQGNASS